MNMNLQPILESELVQLAPLKAEDFESLYEVASDPLIWEQHQDNKRYTLEGFTKFFEGGMQSKGAFLIWDKISKTIIGSSRYKIIDAEIGVIEIGWTFLARKYWGGTYNKAVKKLMINHALKEAECVVFYVDKSNFRSQNALLKLGAQNISNSGQPWVLDKNSNGLTFCMYKML